MIGGMEEPGELKREILTTIMVMANIAILIAAAVCLPFALNAMDSGITSPLMAIPGLIFATYGIVFVVRLINSWNNSSTSKRPPDTP